MDLNRVKIVDSRHEVTNELVAERAYHICASAKVDEAGKLKSFDGGSIRTLPDQRQMATFNNSMGNTLHVDFCCGAEEQGAVLTAINGFIADLKGGEA